MERMKILVCGGRDFTDMDKVRVALGDALPGTIFAHGDANGADHLCHLFATQNGFDVRAYPADWRKHGKAAGPIRNREMLDDFKPDLVVAFQGGRGTADMMRRARLAGVDTKEVP